MELLFVAFAAFLTPLLVAVTVHKVPFWEHAIGSWPLSPAT